MTNAEAIDILRQKYRTVSQCLTADECRENNEAIRLAIAALERDEWISVEEKLPEESGAYLVYLQAPLNFGDERSDWCYVTEMHFDKGQTMWQGNNESYNAILSAVDKEDEYFVSHYRPLPEPPKEETNRGLGAHNGE